MIALRRPATVGRMRAWLAQLDFDPLEALPLLTVVLLLTAMPDQWYLRGPLVAVFAVGVVYRKLLATAPYWYFVATLLGATVYLNWESSDNHRYLFVYWCLTLCCACSLPRQQQAAALAISSRWLIGLCMVLACAWKLAMPDYRDSSFFQFELLADSRFASFAAFATGLPSNQLASNDALRDQLRDSYLLNAPLASVQLAGSEATRWLALAMTWWTVAIEGLLAAAFLWPDGRRVATSRNTLLLAFAVTTYFLAPVRGFGWMLMLLGLAQCDERDRHFRPLYLAALVLIQLYTLPVSAVLERLAQGP